MERCFIATNENEFIKAYEKYKAKSEQQRKAVNEFFKAKGIESNQYMVGGNGFVNTHFEERDKSNIVLYIKPTENDMKNYSKMLKVPNKNHGLCGFKKNSAIAKEFAQKCIDEKIVINLWKPRAGDYFNSISYYGCSWELFELDGKTYLRVESDYLNKDELPEGLIEIKQSEYYQKKEKLENRKAN